MSLGRLAVIAALMSVTACAQQRSDRSHREPEAGVAVDTQVMAYLSMARAHHHEANLKEDDDLPAAIATLEQLTHAKRPHPTEQVPEIEEILADTFARVAELEVRQGDLAKAGENVREGLMHAEGPSYFRGHLLEVGGIVEEARAAELRDAGKPSESLAAKKRALDLLHEAVLVQERVVDDSLAPRRGSAPMKGREGGTK